MILSPGTRVFNLIFKYYGTVILDEGEFVQCVWDKGENSTIRKNCIAKVSDPHPAMVALANELNRQRNLERLYIKENCELSTNSKFESQQLDLAITKIVDLRGKEKTMFSEAAVRVELEQEIEEKNRVSDLKDFENIDHACSDVLGVILDQVVKEVNQNKE